MGECCTSAATVMTAAKLFFFSAICLLMTMGGAFGFSCSVHKYNNTPSLMCSQVEDGDLPFKSDTYNGDYDTLELVNSNLTSLPADAFGQSITFNELYITNLPKLVQVQSGFLGKQTDSLHK